MISNGDSRKKKAIVGAVVALVLFLSTGVAFATVWNPDWVNPLTSTTSFTYTGTPQEWVAPENGWYKFEVWGGSGGSATNTNGYGGYSTGVRYMTKGQKIYAYVGGQGANVSVASTIPQGGWNGGGTGQVAGRAAASNGGGGGGATDFRFTYDASDPFKGLTGESGDPRFIVAGGGGGKSGHTGLGGNGGGTSGAVPTTACGATIPTAGQQIGGRISGGDATNGYMPGQAEPNGTTSGWSSGGDEGNGGGGGGWWGGRTNKDTSDNETTGCAVGGAGGSGYIGGVISRNGVTATTTAGSNSGNGKASITLVQRDRNYQWDYQFYSNTPEPADKSVQEFEAPFSGIYQLEAWGAGGSRSNQWETADALSIGGTGGYSSGKIYIKKGDKVYVSVGQAGRGYADPLNGTAKANLLTNWWPTTWGGGGALTSVSHNPGQGGGATDFRTVPGDWDSADGLRSRILVAGGGGGPDDYSANDGYGGHGGGLNGGCKVTNKAAVATEGCTTQTSGYSFGIGIPDNSGSDQGSGGGGWWGGARPSGPGASGGSGYVSGLKGAVAVTSTESSTPVSTQAAANNDVTKSYSPYTLSGRQAIFEDAVSLGGSRVSSSMPIYSPLSHDPFTKGNWGSGYARISLIQELNDDLTPVNMTDKTSSANPWTDSSVKVEYRRPTPNYEEDVDFTYHPKNAERLLNYEVWYSTDASCLAGGSAPGDADTFEDAKLSEVGKTAGTGQCATLGSIKASQNGDQMQMVKGLAPDTKYYFRIHAVSSTGASWHVDTWYDLIDATTLTHGESSPDCEKCKNGVGG
ncbi:MAG: hypothetical protein LBQ41_03950 [Candidatus Ancillula sp.]|jgi:hypothetical protein|nr:hypothetical protein [Candidatus Ancillula sp.]